MAIAVGVDGEIEGRRNLDSIRHENAGSAGGNIQYRAVDLRGQIDRTDLARFQRQLARLPSSVHRVLSAKRSRSGRHWTRPVDLVDAHRPGPGRKFTALINGRTILCIDI